MQLLNQIQVTQNGQEYRVFSLKSFLAELADIVIANSLHIYVGHPFLKS